MSTKSYVVTVPMKTDATADQSGSLAAIMTTPDAFALEAELAKLFARIDAAGESVVAVQTIQAGYGVPVPQKVGTFTQMVGIAFGYTHSMVIITRTH